MNVPDLMAPLCSPQGYKQTTSSIKLIIFSLDFTYET